MAKKVLMSGASGRMGQEIISLLADDNELSLSQGVAATGDFHRDFSQVKNDVDVVIDFSLPELFRECVAWCRDNQVPMVSGTTGITAADNKLLTELAEVAPVLWAPNMSLGVAFVAELLTEFSKLKGDFNFQIEEFHHKHKKDKPSGTAKFLKEKLDQAVAEETPEVLAVRGGGIFGVHKVWAMSEEETILLEHTALNRSVFARGAVTAARWLHSQKPGLYTMSDLLS